MEDAEDRESIDIIAMIKKSMIARPMSGLIFGAPTHNNAIMEIGQKIAGLVNEINSFAHAKDNTPSSTAAKIGGKPGIDQMIDYIRIQCKTMIWENECLHRDIAALEQKLLESNSRPNLYDDEDYDDGESWKRQ